MPLFWSFCLLFSFSFVTARDCGRIAVLVILGIIYAFAIIWHCSLLTDNYEQTEILESCDLKPTVDDQFCLFLIRVLGPIWFDILRDGCHLIIVLVLLLYVNVFRRGEEENTRPLISNPFNGRLLNPSSIFNRRKQRRRIRYRRSTFVFRYVLRRTGQIHCRLRRHGS